MPDTAAPLDPRHAWTRHMGRIGDDHGFFERLSPRHMVLFVDEGDTLVLSFDRADRLWNHGDSGLPMGFECVTALEYSLLSVMSLGRTWFRDNSVEQMLKALSEDGTFASYRHVLIIASGPDCGHAAARAAQYIPGARVLLSRPVAAVSVRHAPFETRFRDARIADPDSPLPLGPEALQSAAQTMVLFDPTLPPEAAQAALFRAPNTMRIAMPHAGGALDRAMTRGEALVPLTRHLQRDTLTKATARQILRPILRRDPGYLARLKTMS